jgi:hypothetical protein
MHGRLVGDVEEQNAQRDGLRAAHWPVSPLARPAQISGDNVVVIAGESDLVTGLPHAQSLVHHFDTPLVLFEGGHLLHFGRERAFVPVWDMLRRQGHIEGGPGAKS